MGTVAAVLFITIILNYVLKKLNFLVDQTNISTHKKFVNGQKITPLSGGLVFFLTLAIFIPETNKLFVILIFFIFLTGLLSDLNILHSPFFRIIFQTIVIGAYLLIFDSFVSSIRVDFLDNLLNIFIIKLIFTLFCTLVLINGTNFIDGVNTLVTGYFLLIFSNILYLAQVKGLNLDLSIVTICLICLSILYIFNLFGKIFLGDGGSYLVSFVTSIILIKFSNDNYIVSPYYVAALLWYPAYENLFSIVRKKIINKSPSTPDSEHLHQLIYLYLDKSFNIDKNFSNTLAGILIFLYNLSYLLIIFDNFNHTKTLIYSVIFNILFYNFLYFLLKKKLIKNK